jgi:NAD(P)-dependent dehydrogenase (short-subunit alcohol dehydrogenase family)
MTTILITGAEQGLGRALAERYAADHPSHRILQMPGDVCRAGKRSIEAWLTPQPRIDIVINNYGRHHLSWIGTTPEEDEGILWTNVMGPYWIINYLVARGDICIVVNVASQTWRVPQRCSALYCASKAALVQLTRVMARELGPKGWTISAICPGKIRGTRMTELVDAQVEELRGWSHEEAETYAQSLVPVQRFTYPEEVASMIMSMLEAGRYLNGTILDFTGGQ